MSDRIKSYIDQLSVGLKRPTAIGPGRATEKQKAPQKMRGRPPTRGNAWERMTKRDPMAWTRLKINRQWTMRVRQYAQLNVRVMLALAALDGPANARQVRQVTRYWRGDVRDRLRKLERKGLTRKVAPGRYVLTERGQEVAGVLG